MENKIQLINGIEIPNIAYGSAIVLRYMYGDYNKKTILKYWIKNILKNRKQLKYDIGLKRILKLTNTGKTMLIDTSRAYAGSEMIIGKYIKKYGRENFFITTKLCNSDQLNHNVEHGIEQSIKNLGIDQIDLYLMHWPVEGEYIESWKKMEEMYEKGLVKAIGVCNFNIKHMEELKKYAKILPMVNQFECHPLFNQEELRKYCVDNNIQVMAYTSTARMDERLYKTVLPKLAHKYNKTISQIIIRWHIQLGNIPIINTSDPKHFRQNYDVYDFELTIDEINQINAININSRLRYDPENCDFSQL